MTPSLKKLVNYIDLLAKWLHENPNTAMPSQYKQKALLVLEKIINGETLCDQEWDNLKPEIFKPSPIPKKKQNSTKKKAASKKKKKYSKPPARIVRGGLPSLGKRR